MAKRAAKKSTYDESSIEVLEGLEGVRRSPGMYIGETNDAGIFQMWREGFDNCCDEALAGHGKLIRTFVDTKTKTITITDEGRGIPVGIHEKTKESTLTTVMTKIHAGGKFASDGKAGAYKSSIGTHGLGISATNALSDHLTVHTFRNKKWHMQFFRKGIPQGKVKQVKSTDLKDQKSGTVISFQPDFTILKGKIPVERIKNWISTASYFYPDVKFVLDVDGKSKTYARTSGIKGLLAKWIKNRETEPLGTLLYIQTPNATLAIQWTTSDSDSLISYVNGLRVDAGVHITRLKKILLDEFTKVKLKSQTFAGEDLMVGLFGILKITMGPAQFTSQTKETLSSPEAKVIVDGLQPELEKWATKNKKLLKDIAKRAAQFYDLRSEYKDKKKFASKLVTKRGQKILLPPKLRQAYTKKPQEKELFLVEGDSADGTAKNARDPRYQEVLPLRGKILNVFKATPQKTFDNLAIQDILKAIGFNPKLKDPYSQLRVGKIIFLSDADPDGRHINTLLSGVAFKILRPLFDRHMIYYGRLPLYMVKVKNNRYFGNKMEDIEKYMPANMDRSHITRMKGLGEVDYPILRRLAFDPETRDLIRLDAVKGSKLRKFVSTLDENVTFRREMLGVSDERT